MLNTIYLVKSPLWWDQHHQTVLYSKHICSSFPFPSAYLAKSFERSKYFYCTCYVTIFPNINNKNVPTKARDVIEEKSLGAYLLKPYKTKHYIV